MGEISNFLDGICDECSDCPASTIEDCKMLEHDEICDCNFYGEYGHKGEMNFVKNTTFKQRAIHVLSNCNQGDLEKVRNVFMKFIFNEVI